MYDTVVAIALRTTGPDPHKDEIVEVAAAVYADGRIDSRFCERIRPAGALSPGAIKLTGLTPSMLKNARGVDAVLADFLDCIPEEKALCISHNARSARAFLRRATKDRFKLVPLDTFELARICLPCLPSHTLDALCEHFGLPDADAGSPPADCEATVRLFEKLIDRALDLPAAVLTEINRLFAGWLRSSFRDFFRGIEEQVRRRKSAANVAHFEDLFRKETPPKPRRKLPAPEDYKLIDGDAVAALLGPEGAFAHELQGYEHREEQIVMARAVADAMNGSQHLLVEAGTGIGKSLAYLVPAVLWSATNDTPVVLSTNTKNLQAQLFHKDLPLIRDVLDTNFDAVLIKGRRNYLCLRKLFYLLRHASLELDRDERLAMAGVVVWAASTETGDISENVVGDRPGARGIGAKVSSPREECAGPDCRYRKQCFLYRARRKALAANIIVANHSVVLAEMGMPDSSAVLPPHAQIVFDEAHNLENAATSNFSIEVSLPRIRYMLRRLWRPGRPRAGTGLVPSVLHGIDLGTVTGDPELQELAARYGQEIIEAVAGVEPALSPFFAALERLLAAGGGVEKARFYPDRKRESLWAPITAAKEALVSALATVMRPAEALVDVLRQMESHELPDQADFVQQLDAAVQWLKEEIHHVELVLGADDENYVYWVERAPRQQGGVRAWAAPIQVGPMLFDYVYSQKETVVFTSATLSVGGSSDFLAERLGIDRIESERLVEMNAGTPFDYERQCMVMVPTFLPEPDEEGRNYVEELGVLLAEVFRRTRGRAMALFTSHDMLRRTTGVLQEEMLGDGMQILAQGISGSRENITEVFKGDIRSVLMGTHSFWEGVDLVGETLSCLVVARLPFAVFTDPIHQARCEQVEADGGDAFLGYSLPSAVIRLRQGFGRLIRHRTDRGIVIIADRRIVARRYGEWFRRSLPAPTQVFRDRDEFLDAIEEFLDEELCSDA